MIGEIFPKRSEDLLDANLLQLIISSRFFDSGLEVFQYAMSGELDWRYYGYILTPFPFILNIIGENNWFYFFIIDDFLSFIFLYILGKKIYPNKKNAIIVICSVYVLIKQQILLDYSLAFLPYFVYLIFFKKILSFKHYFLVVLFGLSSSFIQLIPGYFFTIFFLLFFYRKFYSIEIIKKTLILFLLLSTGIITQFNYFILLFENGIDFFNRSQYAYQNRYFTNPLELLQTIYKTLVLGMGNSSIFLFKGWFFYLPKIILINFLILISFFNFRNLKTIKLFILFLILYVLIIFIIKNSIFINIDISSLFLDGKIFYSIYFFFSLILIYSISEFKFIDKLSFKIIFSIIIFFIANQSHLYFTINHFLKENVSNNSYNLLKKDFNNGNYFHLLKNLKEIQLVKNDVEKLSSFKKSFTTFYRPNDFIKIKEITKNDLVAPINIDSATLIYNNIYTIGGYFVLYPLSYMEKFSLIIKDLKSYKNFVGANFNLKINEDFGLDYEKKYLSKVNFNQLYRMNVKYILSKNLLVNKELTPICINCSNNFNNRMRLNLYKLNHK